MMSPRIRTNRDRGVADAGHLWEHIASRSQQRMEAYARHMRIGSTIEYDVHMEERDRAVAHERRDLASHSVGPPRAPTRRFRSGG